VTCHNKISRKSRGAPTQAIDFTQPNTLESSKSPTEVSNLGGHGSNSGSLRLALQPTAPAISPGQQDAPANHERLAQTETGAVQETAILPSRMRQLGYRPAKMLSQREAAFGNTSTDDDLFWQHWLDAIQKGRQRCDCVASAALVADLGGCLDDRANGRNHGKPE